MRLFRDALWTLAFAALVVVLSFLIWSLYGTAHSHKVQDVVDKYQKSGSDHRAI